MDNHNPLKGKTLLVVNTGSIKKRFIFQKLKKLELNVLILNKEKNWASAYADGWIFADTYNHQEAIQNIKVFLTNNPNTKLDGAITFWEDDIPLLAKICREFKLVGNSMEAAINTRDKFKMQEIFKNCGQPHIREHLLKTKADLDLAMKNVGFPAVIKPLYGADSEFVVYVANEEEAKDAYNYVRKNCTSEFNPIFKYNKNLFAYQEFVDGHEFSLEGYSQHGVPHLVGIHEKTAMELPFFMETGDYIPPRINEEQKIFSFARPKPP
jgi:carnosine synthase